MSEIQSTIQTAQDGTQIYVHYWGGSKPQRILLCIQGLGGHGGYYDVLGEHFREQDTVVVAPDLRGHGHSQGVRGDIKGFEPYLQDIEATITWTREKWPGRPLFLLGESMGSSIAIGYITSMEQRAEEIAGLALVSPVLRAIVQPSIREILRGTRALLTPTRPLMVVTGREELGCRETAFNDRLRADELFIRQVSMRFLLSISRWLKQMQKRASRVKIPLLVLQGGQDYVAHPTGSSQFLEEVGSSEVVNRIFPEAFHCLFHDPATPEVLQELDRWLNMQTARFYQKNNKLPSIS